MYIIILNDQNTSVTKGYLNYINQPNEAEISISLIVCLSKTEMRMNE